jgi:site-specific recombinase XerD
MLVVHQKHMLSRTSRSKYRRVNTWASTSRRRFLSRNYAEYKTKRVAEVRPATVNHEFSRLRHVFECAVDWGYTKTNPCKGIKELKEPSGRIRYLTPEEIVALLAECGAETLKQNRYNAGRPLSELLNVYLRPIVEIAIH